MARITTFTHVTLDGVMQAPARPDEDMRGGFELGGWEGRYADEVMAGVAAKGMAAESALLIGRRTYEDFFRVWPSAPQPNPFTDILNPRGSTSRPGRCRSRCHGRTRRCWRATQARPWPS